MVKETRIPEKIHRLNLRHYELSHMPDHDLNAGSESVNALDHLVIRVRPSWLVIEISIIVTLSAILALISGQSAELKCRDTVSVCADR